MDISAFIYDAVGMIIDYEKFKLFSLQRMCGKCEIFRQATNYITMTLIITFLQKCVQSKCSFHEKITYCYENYSDSERYLNSLKQNTFSSP